MIFNSSTVNADENDDDSDGLPNYLEEFFGTDKSKPDSDGDGLTDYQEIYLLGTSPVKSDSDNNGVNDGQ